MGGARVIRFVLFAFVIAVAQRQCMAFDDDLKLEAKSSKELIRIYQTNGTLKQRIEMTQDEINGDAYAKWDRYNILDLLARRDDPDAYAFFRSILLKAPGKIDRHYINIELGDCPTEMSPTEWFLVERREGYHFFSMRNDFIDSPTLFAQIRKNPCLLPYSAFYVVAKKDRLTPGLKEQISRLDLSRDGDYFEAWARYLKVRLLDRPEAQIETDSKFIAQVFLKSLDSDENLEPSPLNSFYLLNPVTDLAYQHNAIAIQALFTMPHLDGGTSLFMGAARAGLAANDFDFFCENARKVMPKDKLDAMLSRLGTYEMFNEYDFKKKYAEKITYKSYAYYEEMKILLNGLPGHKRTRDVIKRK